MFALVLQGFGITVVALLGILGCLAHLKLFTGLVRLPGLPATNNDMWRGSDEAVKFGNHLIIRFDRDM